MSLDSPVIAVSASGLMVMKDDVLLTHNGINELLYNNVVWLLHEPNCFPVVNCIFENIFEQVNQVQANALSTVWPGF